MPSKWDGYSSQDLTGMVITEMNVLLILKYNSNNLRTHLEYNTNLVDKTVTVQDLCRRFPPTLYEPKDQITEMVNKMCINGHLWICQKLEIYD